MENFTTELINEIECFLSKKLSLYKELNSVLEKERNIIVNMDIDSLWKSAEEKKKLTEDIQKIREKILCILSEHKGFEDIDINSFSVSYLINTICVPKQCKKGFKKIKRQLEQEKQKLTNIAIENKKYVQEYLSVIDDIIFVAAKDVPHSSYSFTGEAAKLKTSNSLISAEV